MSQVRRETQAPLAGKPVELDAVGHLYAAEDLMVANPEDHLARQKVLAMARELEAPSREPLVASTWNGDRPEPRRWLVPEWLPANRVTMFTGPGGIGKSRLALQLAAGIASGGGEGDIWIETPMQSLDYLRLGGQVPKDGVAVVFATWEDEIEEVWRRLSQLSGDAAPWVTPTRLENLKVVNMAEHGPIWAPETIGSKHMTTMAQITATGRALQLVCEEQRAALLVIDPLAAAYLSDENNRALVRLFMTHWNAWASRGGCAVFILAHPPKSEFHTSGSSDWQAASRSLWHLDKVPIGLAPKGKSPDTREYGWKLTCTKANYAPEPPAWRLDWDVTGAPGPGAEGLRWKVAGPWVDIESMAEPSANGHQNDMTDKPQAGSLSFPPGYDAGA